MWGVLKYLLYNILVHPKGVIFPARAARGVVTWYVETHLLAHILATFITSDRNIPAALNLFSTWSIPPVDWYILVKQQWKRISKHKSTIRTGLNDLPVPKHFAEKAHSISQLRFRVIDSILTLRRGGDRQLLLRERELMWIHKLDCLAPRGLNLEFKIHSVTR